MFYNMKYFFLQEFFSLNLLLSDMVHFLGELTD
jgi:hypothetical protein